MNTAGKMGLLALASFGLLMVIFGIYFIIEAKQSTQWDRVDGKIVDRYVHRTKSVSNRSSASSHYFQYNVSIKYNYAYQGKEHEGTRFSLGTGQTVEDGFKDKQEAQQWLKESEYQIGAKIPVFVKPGFAEQTVISSGINAATYVPIILGLFFIGTAYLIFFLASKAALAKKQSQQQNQQN